MASVDCAKYTAGEAKGLRVHFDEKERMERTHSNEHINPSLTPQNFFYKADSFQNMLIKMDDYVKKADANEKYEPSRKRKDRKTCVMMEIPIPMELTQRGVGDEFIKKAYDEMEDFCERRYGEAMFCGMTVHKDEVHEYLDHGGVKRMSLEHGHAMVVPFAKWTEQVTVRGEDGKPMREPVLDDDGNEQFRTNKKGKRVKVTRIVKKEEETQGVNCKNFLTRDFLRDLQTCVDQMCYRDYGIHYKNGEKPQHMTVEELKAASASAEEVLERAEQEAKQELATAQRKIREVQEEAEAITNAIARIPNAIARIHKVEAERQEKEEALQELENEKLKQEEKLKSERQELEELENPNGILSKLRGERDKAEQELQAKKKELKDVKQQLSRSLLDAIDAQDGAKEAKAKKEKAEMELKEAEEAIESTQKALNDTRIAYERESQELEKLVKEKGIQQEENELLKGICDSLNQSLDKTIEKQEKAIADAKAKMGEMNRPRHKGR